MNRLIWVHSFTQNFTQNEIESFDPRVSIASVQGWQNFSLAINNVKFNDSGSYTLRVQVRFDESNYCLTKTFNVNGENIIL